jgi:hypothetical protein
MKRITTTKNQQKIEFSPEELDFIAANWRMTDRAFLAAFEERFGPGLTFGYWRVYKTAQGLIKQDQVSWEPEQVQFLLDNYQTMGNLAIAEQLGWPSGAKEGQKRVWKKMNQMGLKRSPEQVLKIKKNNPQSYPDGTIWYQECRNDVMIKVNGKTMFYRIWVWEGKHGPVPKGNCITHKNGDNRDCRIENLEMVSRSEVTRRGAVEHQINLSDNTVIAAMSRKKPGLKESLEQNPALVDLQRQVYLLKRQIKITENG